MKRQVDFSALFGSLIIPLLLACPLWGAPPTADPLDWPNWRGPERNGMSRETGVAKEWTDENVAWESEALASRTTPIVLRGKLYTILRDQPDTNQQSEKVICADARTGEILWEHRFNVFLCDVPDTRVGWSCCAGDPETGRIYALGVCGLFLCLDGETGETIWSRSLGEEFGLLNTYGGRTNTPVVFEDLVIVSGVTIGWGEMAKPADRYLAFDKATGELIWINGTTPLPADTTYSTPILTVLNGQAAMVFGSSDGEVWATQPRTGQPIWHYKLSPRGLNVTPLVVGDTVYMAQSEENRDDNSMGAVVAIDGGGEGDITASGELWRVKELVVGRSTPLLIDGRLYCVESTAKMHVLDPQTGEAEGRPLRLLGTIVHGSPLYADGHIYVATTSAWHVIEITPDGPKIAQRQRLQGEEILGSPIVSHGLLYIPTTRRMICVGDPAAAPAEPAPRPPAATEIALEDETPAHLQLAPAESLIRPGETLAYRARVFNAKGQFLGERPATFSVDGGGQIDERGRFAADSIPRHQAANVTAAFEGLNGAARVRIVPDLPWSFDFADNEVPVTWVGARHRHQTRNVDGELMMVKISTIPKGTRSQCWMGHADMHDYTVQADLRGAEQNGLTPDMGLIAQRYTLDLMGASQQLQIRTWTPQLQMAVTVPFAWRPDVWYTMKFRAAVEDGKAVLRGKVWERGADEPEAWSVEAVDDNPNLAGSPGLFGNATNAEIFIDNISVTPN